MEWVELEIRESQSPVGWPLTNGRQVLVSLSSVLQIDSPELQLHSSSEDLQNQTPEAHSSDQLHNVPWDWCSLLPCFTLHCPLLLLCGITSQNKPPASKSQSQDPPLG